jgi:hypothetical protein
MPAPDATPSSSIPTATQPGVSASAPARAPAAPGVADSTDATSDGQEATDDDDLEVDAHAALPDGIVRSIVFPVLGPVQYGNDWGACRDGCSRRHQGTDLIGVRMQPLLAAVDGTVTRLRHESRGTAGTVITVTGADGWYYNYFHVNNDTPGTDDGAAEPEWRIAPGLTVGSAVRAGQVIAYMGDSGNAEGSVPHLHFEIRRPDRVPVNPYPSLKAAQQDPACAPALGAPIVTDASALSPAAIAVIPLDGGGRWLIDRDGRLFAEGAAADTWGACAAVPAPVTALPAPVTTLPAPVTAEPTAIAADSATTWTVERGDSLWNIVQETYGVSEVGATVSFVNLVFDGNRDQLTDPNVLNIGMLLRLPAS